MAILRFAINSRKMILKKKTDTEKGKESKKIEKSVIFYENTSTRFLAKVVGAIVSVFPAVIYTPLYYRALENDKIRALEICKGDFDSHHPISGDAKDGIKWWRNNNQMKTGST